MRIRNSRSPFPPPSLPHPISRSTQLLHFEECFLVEETNRQIGWSFNTLKNPACQVIGEGSCGELKKMTSREIEPINCEDEEKGKINCMREKSSQVLGGQPEAQDMEANEGNEPCLYTNNQEDGNASGSAVNFDIAPSFASSELAELPYKMKNQTYQLETRNKEEVALPEKVIEPRKIPQQGDVEDKNGSKRTATIYCPINCEYFIPPDNKGIEGHGMPEGMDLEDTTAKLKEKPRKGRKRKQGDQSGDPDWFIEMFTGKQRKPQKRGKLTANKNYGCMEMMKRKRGRPKRG